MEDANLEKGMRYKMQSFDLTLHMIVHLQMPTSKKRNNI